MRFVDRSRSSLANEIYKLFIGLSTLRLNLRSIVRTNYIPTRSPHVTSQSTDPEGRHLASTILPAAFKDLRETWPRFVRTVPALVLLAAGTKCSRSAAADSAARNDAENTIPVERAREKKLPFLVLSLSLSPSFAAATAVISVPIRSRVLSDRGKSRCTRPRSPNPRPRDTFVANERIISRRAQRSHAHSRDRLRLANWHAVVIRCNSNLSGY